MIGKLKGIVDSIFEDFLILDVNGIGYRIFCSSKNLINLNIGDNISLYILMSVKEDSITLYGFSSVYEKNWFEMLCKVNGIGNKMALKIMSSMTIDEILNAIDNQDSKLFSKAQGVGTKIASRIIIELKNIRKTLNISTPVIKSTSSININDTRLKDAVSALENLGYQKNIAYNVVSSILKERNDIVIESLITEALKKINNF